MWKYNPCLSGTPISISTRLNKDIYHICVLDLKNEKNIFQSFALKSPFSLIFLVKRVIRRLLLAYIGFAEHNTSNFPPKLHNPLQDLNISNLISCYFFSKTTENAYTSNSFNFVENFQNCRKNIFLFTGTPLQPSQQI